MIDWAAWGPTIVSFITCVFFAGVFYNNQFNQSKRLNAHDVQLEEHTRDITTNRLDIRELKAWGDGYASARAVYDRSENRN